jgi:hypothetical protein
MELAQVEPVKQEKKDPFGMWKNIYSAPIKGVY